MRTFFVLIFLAMTLGQEPKAEVFFERAQQALAQGTCPDFKDLDPAFTTDPFSSGNKAFRAAYDQIFPGINRKDLDQSKFKPSFEWFQIFLDEIRKRSGGKADAVILGDPGTPRFLYSDPLKFFVSNGARQAQVVIDPLPDGPAFSCTQIAQ